MKETKEAGNMEQQNTAPQAEIFQNVPPHDDAAELAVLGAMFLDREAASLALEMLTGEDFYRPDHRQVFEAAEELYHSGVPIDMITVKNKLEEKQVFEQIGGLPFLPISPLLWAALQICAITLPLWRKNPYCVGSSGRQIIFPR